MTTTRQAIRDLMDAIALLGANVGTARRVLDALDEERCAIDWHPGASSTAGMPKGIGGHSDPVGRIIESRAYVAGEHDQVLDDIATIASLSASFVRVVVELAARHQVRPPVERKLCDSTGLAGAGLPWVRGSTDTNNGWSDTTCTDLAAKGTLCATCYQRHRRWRAAHNLPALDGEEVTA